jgi:hypothetical protein
MLRVNESAGVNGKVIERPMEFQSTVHPSSFKRFQLITRVSRKMESYRVNDEGYGSKELGTAPALGRNTRATEDVAVATETAAIHAANVNGHDGAVTQAHTSNSRRAPCTINSSSGAASAAPSCG